MKNVQLKLKPQKLNYDDAIATMSELGQTFGSSVRMTKYPVIELCDNKGTWGAVFCPASLPNLSPKIWLVTALPELSSSKCRNSFFTSPTLFHPVPNKRDICSAEGILQKTFAETLAQVAFANYIKQGKKFKKKPIRKWAHKIGRREVNFMLNRIYDRGNSEAMKATYRYPFGFRRRLYDAVCMHGKYAYQLLYTFPYLAAALWCTQGETELRNEIQEMVLSGAKLKEISKRAGIPWVLRKLPPQLTNRCSNPSLISEICRRLNLTKLFQIRAAIYVAQELSDVNWNGDVQVTYQVANFVTTPNLQINQNNIPKKKMDFLLWAAKHAAEYKQSKGILAVTSDFRNLSDWARDINYHNPWSPDLSVEKAFKYSRDWHRCIFSQRREEEIAFFSPPKKSQAFIFPEPWIEPWHTTKNESGNEKKYHIIPLDKGHKLTDEGHRMKNCIKTYRKDVQEGQCYIYSLRVGNKRWKSLVTIKLRKICPSSEDVNKGYEYYISQAFAKCNTKVPTKFERIIKEWCEQNNIARTKNPYLLPRNISTTSSEIIEGTGTAWTFPDMSVHLS